jgi:hypothetical protein
MKPRIASHFMGCTCEHTGAEHGWGTCEVEGCRCRGGWFGPQEAVARGVVLGSLLVLALWLLSRALYAFAVFKGI